MARIYLSPPDVGAGERARLLEAFDSGWIAPVGPQLEAFERELAAFVGVPHAVALSSGTAALHLALRLAGVEAGDEVLTASMTFVATANAVVYQGARPVFLDSERESWNLDPELLAEELDACARRGAVPRALIAVDLYGQCADYQRIRAICERHGVALIEDAAEALGGEYRGRAAGSLGDIGAFSFNGNKIITTSGGGMLVTGDRALADKARFWATQAREPVAHYQHEELGYNYRMSNLLAALGRAQLDTLPARVRRRRDIRAAYARALADAPGIAFAPEAEYGRSNGWLTCITVAPEEFGATRDDLRLALEREDIESRPLWKPMHMQPLYADARMRGGAVCERLFERGLCLPSGSSLRNEDIDRVVDIIRRTGETGGRSGRSGR
ncbi:DegT/DnrJ/EryC1/StrS family aminotransferase [Haliangium ochraceum]|uniref:GDP-perosamine synthase n=1 Tax=Haliangium ochraceum (strain DSM 14365 / JCM 11303 / SMP-2) TaxID=502025 RepID=D0LFR3_HALO1|nr:aminotransferase class I/II-fold pyridoxal phosphate-dependent enzyme [Haliangium ochraceum]ACY14515.1 DegT/DnrJ/EryC1/StrS aminotransferase [Haliangium ochraceum DSM 14365]